MSSVEMIPLSATIYRIGRGKKTTFGKVWQRPDKSWCASYRFDGLLFVASGASAREAFEAVVDQRNLAFARSQGFASVAELEAHNRRVRAENRDKRKAVEARFRAMRAPGAFEAELERYLFPGGKR